MKSRRDFVDAREFLEKKFERRKKVSRMEFQFRGNEGILTDGVKDTGLEIRSISRIFSFRREGREIVDRVKGTVR